MLKSIKTFLKPAFMLGLRALVDWRWLRRRKGKSHNLPGRLVISLTSYPKRYNVLLTTLRTLMTQSISPDEIVLWIAHEDVAAIPSCIRALERDGLKIYPTQNLRSYKKIIPALSEFGDSFIVTADDDVYYPACWLETFCNAYIPSDKTVLAHRAHRMILDGEYIGPYDNWLFNIAELEACWDVFFTGVGGVFYPPGTFHPDVTNVDKFQMLCPDGDDIWLNWMTRLNGNMPRKVGPPRRFYEWLGSQSHALQNTNRGACNGNDQQVRKIVEAYGIPGRRP